MSDEPTEGTVDEVPDATSGLVPPPTPEEMEQVVQLPTAFVVYVDNTGHWVADSTLINRPIVLGRPASMEDFYHAACTIKRDIDATTAANNMMQIQQQMAQAVMQQRQQADLAMAAGIPQGGLDLSALKRR